MKTMHDWTLKAVHVDWANALLTIHLQNPRNEVTLIAEGLQDVHIPVEAPWGESVSINETNGPSDLGNGFSKIEIEMQSATSSL